jgi:hypothetical protein
MKWRHRRLALHHRGGHEARQWLLLLLLLLLAMHKLWLLALLCEGRGLLLLLRMRVRVLRLSQRLRAGKCATADGRSEGRGGCSGGSRRRAAGLLLLLHRLRRHAEGCGSVAWLRVHACGLLSVACEGRSAGDADGRITAAKWGRADESAAHRLLLRLAVRVAHLRLLRERRAG